MMQQFREKIVNGFRHSRRIVPMLFIFLSQGDSFPAQAATLYWDVNGTSAGSGNAGGNWNTNSYWSTSSSGTGVTGSYASMAGLTNDIIFSAGTDGTGIITVMVQNVESANAVKLIKVEEGNVTLQGTLTSKYITMTGAGEINVNGNAALLNTVILTGSAGLQKTGGGTMTLNRAATYTGSTHVMDGTLLIGVNDVLPDGSAVTVDSGATLSFSNGGGRSDTIGSLAGAGSVILKGSPDSPQLTVGGNNSSTEFSGTISSTDSDGWLVKTGTGTLTLSGANSYKQATIVSNGTLLINGNQSSATDTVVVATGAVLGGSGTVGGNIHFNAGGNFLFSTNSTLTVVEGKTASFSGFSATNIFGLSSATSLDTYTLINGNVNLTNVANVGINNSHHLGDGKRAYFEGPGLKLVVVLTDTDGEEFSQQTFSNHVYVAVTNLESKLNITWIKEQYISAFSNSPLFSTLTNDYTVKDRRGQVLGRDYQWRLAALSALYTATGSSNTNYAELIRKSLIYETNASSEEIGFTLGQMVYSYEQIANYTNFSAAEQDGVKAQFAKYADEAVGLESGTEMNRGILNTLGLLRVSRLLPNHSSNAVWSATWRNNWTNGLLRIKDNDEDSINYNHLWLHGMMQMVEDLDEMDPTNYDATAFYAQPWVEEIFERHLNIRTPLGIEPEVNYGAISYGLDSAAALEWAGKIYQDGRYRWAAQRVVNFYRAQPDCTNSMMRYPLFLHTDDSVTPIQPTNSSYYSHRRYDREFPNKLALRSGYGSNSTFLALNLFEAGGHGVADGSAIYCLMDQYSLLLSGGHRRSPGEEYSNLLLVRSTNDAFPFGNHYRPDTWNRSHVGLRSGNTSVGNLTINLGQITRIGLRVTANSTSTASNTLDITAAAVGTNITLCLNSNEIVFAGSYLWPKIPLTGPVNLEPYDGLNMYWKFDSGVRLQDVQVVLDSTNPVATSRWQNPIDNWRDSRVGYFGDAAKAHFASVDVTLYGQDGNDHHQYRDIIMLTDTTNLLFWVRDTMIWGGTGSYQAAPLWHVQSVANQGTNGAAWFQTATPTIYDEGDGWTAAGDPRSLLIVLPSRTNMQAQCVSSTYAPGGRPHTIFQKWTGAVTNEMHTAFNSLLIPNAGTNPASLAAQAQLLYENDHAAVVQYRNWLLVDNPEGQTVRIGDLETDYLLLAVELNGTNVVSAAGIGGNQCSFRNQPLTVDDAQ